MVRTKIINTWSTSGVLRRKYGILLTARSTSTGILNVTLDSKQAFEGSYLDIKSITMRDTLQKVLEGVTCISLGEDKPSVSTSLRMIATNSSPDICADQSGCLIHLSTSAGGVP
jgi:hypothetical protein